MNNTTTSISFSIFSNKGVYALLLGSGISKNSGIPTGWDIVIDLIKKLAHIEQSDCIPTPEEWFKGRYNEAPNYSTILSKLVRNSTERVNFLKPYFEPTEEDTIQSIKQPTLTHKQIAALIKKGYIKVVITTNFDRLLEKALLNEGIEPIIIRHPNDIDGALPIVHSQFTLIKINGDYLDSRFLNTTNELSSYDKKLNDYILRIINEFGIISCGWSAKWDLGLVNILKQSENFRFFSYWTYKDNCEQELKEISEFRKGELIKIEDSDTFFNEITEKIIALENINDNHPLSSDIAIARLKRYIVKDEYKILLHDFINNQLNETIKKLNLKDNLNLAPNRENMLPILTYFINNIEDFLQLIIHGVYWSKNETNYLFIHCLSQISEPPKNSSNSFIETTRNFHYFPSLLTFYTIGLSALKNNNYQILNDCFNLKINDFNYPSSNELFLLDRINPHMIDKDLMNNIISQNYLTPISTFLNQTLKPYFIKNLYKEKEYDNMFDVFEYFLSLNFIDKLECNSAPWGEYQWRKRYRLRNNNYILNDYFEEANKLKDDWKPLKAGMFDRKYENFIIVKNKLENYLNDIHLT